MKGPTNLKSEVVAIFNDVADHLRQADDSLIWEGCSDGNPGVPTHVANERPRGTMIDPSEYDDIIVTVAHPWGDGHPTLTQWIANGPGPRRLVGVVAAKRKATGEKVDLAEIPLEYHNSPESRRLQRLGQLPAPWGPPPDDEPAPMEVPDHIRRLVD